MRDLKPDYKKLLFMRTRAEDPDFVLNKPQFAQSRHPGDRQQLRRRLLARGGGVGHAGQQHPRHRGEELCRHLSRELPAERIAAGGAAAAEADAFIARVVAVNGAAPFTVDLPTQTISGPGGPDVAFDIPPADRMRLLEGLDDIGLTLKHTDEIVAFEKRMAASQPWLQEARDSRR